MEHPLISKREEFMGFLVMVSRQKCSVAFMKASFLTSTTYFGGICFGFSCYSRGLRYFCVELAGTFL